MKKTKLITMTSCVAFVVSANAATVTVGSAPVVDGADQSNYATQANKHKFWAENSGAGLTRGQTFTTGSEDVVLNSQYGDRTIKDLGVAPRSMKIEAFNYLIRFRKGGHFIEL